MSFKNTLQEHYQKLHLPVPEYTTIQNEGGLWVSSLTINNKTYVGETKSKKIDAEQSTAKYVMSRSSGIIVFDDCSLQSQAQAKDEICIDDKLPKGNNIILIDLENIPKGIYLTTHKPGVTIFGFLSSYSSVSVKNFKHKVLTIDSGMPNAAR